MACTHKTTIGDNNGVNCERCGEVLEGYGYRGMSAGSECKHKFIPVGDEGLELCKYCETDRRVGHTEDILTEEEKKGDLLY